MVERKHMGWGAASFVAFCLLLAMQAVAGDIAECSMQRESSHSGSGDAKDLGGGVVSYFEVDFSIEPTIVGFPEPPMPIYRGYVVEDCASGRKIRVEGYSCADFDSESSRCVDRRGFVDVEDQIDKILTKAAAPDTTTTFADLFAQLKSLPGSASIEKPHAERRESCACAKAYPELRGANSPWNEY